MGRFSNVVRGLKVLPHAENILHTVVGVKGRCYSMGRYTQVCILGGLK